MENLYDVIVIGGGPAGLTSAIYLARAKYRVLVVERDKFGGQITITHEVVNYPGVGRTSGAELAQAMQKQAEYFGAEFMLANVERLELEGDVKTVYTDKGPLKSFGLLLATGAHPRIVGFPGEEEYRGRGVSYCATCDGEFYTGKEIFVIGGGFAAAEEAVFLTKYARHVNILVRRDDFSCAKSAADDARNHPDITVLTNTQVEEVYGDDMVRSIRYKNTKTGEVTEYKAEEGNNIGVFVFAGYEPVTDLVKGLAELNEQGYIITDNNMKTSIEGLYAAGDVRIKTLRQVVTATGDAALAATELERYAAAMQRKTGLVPKRPEVKKAPHQATSQNTEPKTESGLFDSRMLSQLETVFSKMASPLLLKLTLDQRPASQKLRVCMEELAKLTDKLRVELEDSWEDAPCVRVCRSDGSWTGLAFHGIPGGHEFTSFVLGLYNAAGPGQPVEPESLYKIRAIGKKLDIKVLVSLSCTMCPELVTAAQRIAAENENVSAQIYDIRHFPAIKEQYKVMSVPCLVVNDGETVSFGRKSLKQLLELIA